MPEWTITTVGEIADIFDGPHATPTKTETGPWFLGISSLDQGRLNLAESAHLSAEDFVKWSRRVTPSAGDLLFSYETRLGDAASCLMGSEHVLGGAWGFSDLADTESIHDSFSTHTLVRISRKTIHERSIHGATVDRIPLTELDKWPMGHIQRRHLDELVGAPTEDHVPALDAELSPLWERALLAEQESLKLAELRDTLLPKLMSGEIRVRDAEKAVEETT